MSNQVTELLEEWDDHAGRHKCYYESAQNDGMAVCPRDHTNLRSFLEGSGVEIAPDAELVHGRVLSEPGFRAVNRLADKDKGRPLTIKELRERGMANRNVQYKERDESAREGAVENDTNPDVLFGRLVGARFNHVDEYLGAISTVLITITETQGRLEGMLGDLINAVDAIEGNVDTLVERVGERSEPEPVDKDRNVSLSKED